MALLFPPLVKAMLWLGLEGRKKIKALETDLEHVKDELERYHRAFKQLEVEWSDVLDRLNHQVGRISARARRAANSEPHVEYDDGVDPISREILALRNHK